MVKRAPAARPKKGSPGKDLYIMQCSAAPGILKIGRSNDCLNRARVLQSQQWFYMKVLATYHGAGHQESQVHNLLRDRRLRNVPGREWFTITIQDAMSAIASCLCNDTEPPSESEHTPLFEEQHSHNKCVLQFPEQVRSSEYPLGQREEDLQPLRGEQSFPVLDIQGRLNAFTTRRGRRI
eukprot:7652904-Karenia_brevis.AAC.1